MSILGEFGRACNDTNRAILHIRTMDSENVCKRCGKKFHINNMMKYIQHYNPKIKFEICRDCGTKNKI